MTSLSTSAFLDAALSAGALKFGQFTLKSGRISPYFFNAGLFHSGKTISALAQAYADTVHQSAIKFDMLFGPAYKGIVLSAVLAEQLYVRHGTDCAFAYNRKEAKAHGEGGLLVGAPLKGRVLIVDDVISAGTSVRESIQIIEAAGATPAGVVIALDRCERGLGAQSAAQEVTSNFGIPVISVAKLPDLLTLVAGNSALSEYESQLQSYRAAYGVL